jgi:polyhydroxyalkanoate synthase
MPDTPEKSLEAAPTTADSTADYSRRLGDRHLLDSDALENIDRMTNIALGQLSGGVSPASLAMAYLDWTVHLASSPGKQFQLGAKAMRKAMRLGAYALSSAVTGNAEPCIKPLPGDHRFDHPGWQRFPYNVVYQGFLLNQQWWHNATTGMRGVSKHGEAAVWFTAKQILDMTAPCNVPCLNPGDRRDDRPGARRQPRARRRVLRRGHAPLAARREAGRHRGLPRRRKPRRHAGQGGLPQPADGTDPILADHRHRAARTGPDAVGVDDEVLHPRPLAAQLAGQVPGRSRPYGVHDLVAQPGPEHRNLGMEDYRKLGTLAAIDAISEILPGRKIHAVGYCLGGILLTIAAAAMARDGDDRLASVTLFTTMTDFTDVGEINVFMDASEVTLLEDMMWEKGYLGHKQVSGGFQLLKSADLIWSKMVREYYLGQREPMFDLMAWNADGTRMPYRQHSEVLRRLYVDNELFEGKYMVEGRAISISNIHVPIFAVAASADHVAPWHSVYKLHLQSDATELTFVLTSGGHNVGIVNEPGARAARTSSASAASGERFLDAETWKERTPSSPGSWWPAWQKWLVEHSSGSEAAPPMGAPDKGYAPLCDAPGTYIHQQ